MAFVFSLKLQNLKADGSHSILAVSQKGCSVDITFGADAFNGGHGPLLLKLIEIGPDA
jgi:hypothetical protein